MYLFLLRGGNGTHIYTVGPFKRKKKWKEKKVIESNGDELQDIIYCINSYSHTNLKS